MYEILQWATKLFDIKEHKRLSMITPRHLKYKNNSFIAVLHHSMVFNTEHNSYSKMSGKRSLACSGAKQIINQVKTTYIKCVCSSNGSDTNIIRYGYRV